MNADVCRCAPIYLVNNDVMELLSVKDANTNTSCVLLVLTSIISGFTT